MGDLAALNPHEHGAVVTVSSLVGILGGPDLLLLVKEKGVQRRALGIASIVLEEGAELRPTLKGISKRIGIPDVPGKNTRRAAVVPPAPGIG